MYSPLTVELVPEYKRGFIKVLIWPNQNTQLLKNLDVKALVKLQYKDVHHRRSLAKTQTPLLFQIQINGMESSACRRK